MEERPQTAIKPSRLSSASDVIDALGGTNAVAELLNIGASSVSNYRKQGFPARSHFILAKICKERGLDVADAVFGGYQVKTKKAPYQAAPLQRADTLTSLKEAGFTPVSLPILQPAAPFIDRMGPEMQRRLFTFTDPGGEQLCLRPDLTIPTALAHIASGKSGTARYCYQGTAFRYQPRGSGQPEEFTQLGLEIIGGASAGEDGLADDVDVLKQILTAISDSGLSLENCDIICSDAQHYIRMVDGFDFSEAFARSLKQQLLRNEPLNELAEFLQKRVAMSPAQNLVPPNDSAIIAGRSGAEIRERLERSQKRAELAQEDLDELDRFVSNAVESLEENGNIVGLPSNEEYELFQQARSLGIDETKIFRRPAHSRKMAYYTGLSFEIYASGLDRPIAAGGRYDDLLHSLGAAEPLSAVGGAIALERLNRAVEMQS